ncbi:integrase catalytic domain-containing protein [Trichonephila inaurata madagascariensis]|uniref:Integrase catalytic domain-containing protein n=1 Tax=Trichonephila inaurata madagascariensis TaxID=2747483 RepID=A0A8X6WRJ4_9ARAC|nr:integrase catalytic domain-containing protein [Trichonephila inaurata madagascariensis]
MESRCHRHYPTEDAKRKHAHSDFLNQFKENLSILPDGRHCRVVFGICSPFQLSVCIDHLLENSPACFDDVTQKLKHSFYVDNCVTGVSDIQEQENFIVKAIENCGTQDSNWNNVTTHSKSLSFGNAVDRTPDDLLNDCTSTNPISSISSDMLSDPNDSSSVLRRVSRHGRVIKAPEKLDLFNQALCF